MPEKPDANEASRALRYASNLIKHRLRSAWEIDQALLRRKYSPEIRESVIAKLTKATLLDDARLAKAWLTTRDRLSPRSAWVIKQELKQKGVATEHIQAAITDRFEDAKEMGEAESEEALARTVIKAKERQYAHLAPEVRNRRLIALLLRRGFSYDIARRILNT